MKTFSSPIINISYLGYRLVLPVFNPIQFYLGIRGYPKFLRDLLEYKKLNRKENILFKNLFPLTADASTYHPIDDHYYYQGIWLLQHVIQDKPKRHVDVASRHELSAYISLMTRSEYVDIRPLKTTIKNLYSIEGDILHLPYKDNSISSLSSLHVIEHIGLGRYGDKLNPWGTELACKELQRVLKPKGKLYISTPIGRPRVCFNAHRIHDPEIIVTFFNGLRLLSFSVVDDNGVYKKNVSPTAYKNQSYACGLYIFSKK